MLKYLLFTYLLLLSFLVNAQMIPYRLYNTSNGLIQSQVTAVTQDSKGFMWIGTIAGLNRFDGKSFLKYTERDGLSEDWITALATDKNDNIWIGHWSGSLSVYDCKNNYLKVVELPKGFKQQEIVKIYADPDNGVWVSNKSNKLYYYKDLSIPPEVLDLSSLKLVNQIFDFIINSNKQGALATDKGLVLFDFKNSSIVKNLFNDLPITDVAFLNNKILTFIKGKGLFFVENNKNASPVQLSINGITPQELEDVKHFVSLSNNSIWATTHSGGAYELNLLNTKLFFKKHNYQTGLVYNETNTVFADNENNIWIGTNAGLNQYLGRGFLMSNEWTGLSENIVWDVIVLENNLYCATNNGLSIIDANSLTVIKNYPGIKSKSVTSIGKSIYCNNDNAVFEFINGDYKNIYSTNNTIYAVKAVGNMLYIATDKELAVINTLTQKSSVLIEGDFYRINSGLNKLYAVNVPGEVYAINGTGVSKIKADDLLNELVLGVHEDQNGSLWISTYHSGIFEYKKTGKLNRYELTDEEFNYIPFSIQSDKEFLWIGSNRGLIRMNLSDKKFIVFDESDGFGGVEANANAICGNQSQIYLGTIMGVCSFNKSFTKKITYSPIPQIKSALSLPNYTPVKNGERINFGSNSIKFDLNALSSTWSKKVTYHYRLLGLDSNWILTKNGEVWFRYLKPGTYIFELKASINGQLVPGSKTDRIQFYIKPPFWRTSWFLGMCLLVLGLALYFIFKTKTRHLLLEKIELEGQLLDLQKKLDEANAELKRK